MSRPGFVRINGYCRMTGSYFTYTYKWDDPSHPKKLWPRTPKIKSPSAIFHHQVVTSTSSVSRRCFVQKAPLRWNTGMSHQYLQDGPRHKLYMEIWCPLYFRGLVTMGRWWIRAVLVELLLFQSVVIYVRISIWKMGRNCLQKRKWIIFQPLVFRGKVVVVSSLGRYFQCGPPSPVISRGP